jgi:hypothetical protein
MADVPVAEYYCVQCGECNKWIPFYPTSRVENNLLPHYFPQEFKFTWTHEHQSDIFHNAEITTGMFPRTAVRDLPILTAVKQ